MFIHPVDSQALSRVVIVDLLIEAFFINAGFHDMQEQGNIIYTHSYNPFHLENFSEKIEDRLEKTNQRS